jgi:hypothetical protein
MKNNKIIIMNKYYKKIREKRNEMFSERCELEFGCEVLLSNKDIFLIDDKMKNMKIKEGCLTFDDIDGRF